MNDNKRALHKSILEILATFADSNHDAGISVKDTMADMLSVMAQITGNIIGGIVTKDNIPEALEKLYPLVFLSAIQGSETASEIISERQAQQAVQKAAQQ